MKIPEDVSELISKVYQKKVVLFIGNGASVDAGGPKTPDLVAIIKKAFPQAKYQSDDFIQTCTDVMETTLTSRSTLEDIIRKNLIDLKPSSFHTELPAHVWPAIFTTNYDDLIEQGYRNVPKRVQTLDPIFSDRDLITLNDAEKVKLFKLMGCILSKHPDNKLALTRTDYNRVMRAHPDIFRTLSDIMRDGTILYVGYSFQDSLLLDIIEDLRSLMKDSIPYSYALFPSLDLASVPTVKLIERKIIPLRRTTREFAAILREGVQPKLIAVSDKPGATVVIKKQRKVISHQEMRMYLQAFDFLYEEKLTVLDPDNIETRRDFFRGVLTNWTGFIKNWDFIRVSYDKIAERTKTELDSLDINENKAILFFGPAGSGKTWMLRRLAIDAYKIWGNPVIILRPYYEDIDLKMLASLCEELSYLEKVKRGRDAVVRARVLIIMENASDHVTDFKTISTFMKSRGIPVLVMGSARENEWELACENLSHKAAYPDSYNLDDSFESSEERIQFVKHISRLDVLEGNPDPNEISSIIEKDYQNSFFTSVYSLIEPARPLLDNKIKEEYNNLPPLPKKAYLLVASFYQYSLPMPVALLVRTLECPYSQFIEQIYETEAKKIICSVDAPLEGAFLGTRLRLIAEKLIEKEAPDPTQLTDVLKQTLRRLNPRNIDEVQISRMLLIRHLGPNGTDKRLSIEQTRELFEAAIINSKLEDCAVLHHFGLFESDHGRQDVALSLVERALKVLESRQPLVFYGSERIENIYNTIGLIYMRKAEEAEKTGDIPAAENLYSAATDYFAKARGGELQTPHPYHCESRMYFYRAQKSVDPLYKIVQFSNALDVINDAEDNLPEESLPKLLELRAEILDNLNQIPDLDQVISKLENTPGHEIDGVLAKTRRLLFNPRIASEERERALDILKRMIPANTTNSKLLRAYYKLCKELHPDDRVSLYEILKLRYEIPSEKRNFSMLYDFGVMSFSFEEYPKSLESFRLLEKICQGHPKRWGIHDRGIDKSGNIKEFQGTVVRIESRSLGQIDVLELRRTIPFIPYAQHFIPQIGDNVTFQISFNYRGWLGVDLVK